jgi:hypothetical protein
VKVNSEKKAIIVCQKDLNENKNCISQTDDNAIKINSPHDVYV